MKSIILIITFILISPIGTKADEISCYYFGLDTNTMSLSKICGRINDDGLLILNKDLIKKIRWDKSGLECILVGGTKERLGWYIVNQSGMGRTSKFWTDNCCAPFKAGVVVGLSIGKVIFYNQTLEIVKRTDYIWASGFHN